MAKNVGVEFEPSDYLRLNNTTGADLVAEEFCLIGAKPAVSQEAIASGADGGFVSGGNVGVHVNTNQMVSGEATFGTANASVYWDNTEKKFSDTATAGYYKVGQVKEVLSNGAIVFNMYDIATVVGVPELSGAWFKKTATLTAAAAATAVHLLTDAEVGTKTAFVMGALVKVNGATAWTDATATIVKVQDTAGTPVVGLTVAKAGLTANALLTIGTANVTVGDAIALGTGFTAAKGIDVVADAVFAAGSDLEVTIFGYIA